MCYGRAIYIIYISGREGETEGKSWQFVQIFFDKVYVSRASYNIYIWQRGRGEGKSWQGRK